MTPFRKILVPVDFSPHSDDGMRLAADIARRYEASLTLVHVYQPVAYPFPEGFMLYTPSQLAEMLTEMQKLLDRARAEVEAGGSLRVEAKLLQGIVASEIVTTAQQESFDLIVMGTHGRSGLQHALLGSVAEKVLRKAHCPVLTVRPQSVAQTAAKAERDER
jgi:nucleotide-binding universal stress UspA family protein